MQSYDTDKSEMNQSSKNPFYSGQPLAEDPAMGVTVCNPLHVQLTQDASEPPHTYLRRAGCLQSSCSRVCAVMLRSWSVTPLRCALPARLCVGSGSEVCSKAEADAAAC